MDQSVMDCASQYSKSTFIPTIAPNDLSGVRIYILLLLGILSTSPSNPCHHKQADRRPPTLRLTLQASHPQGTCNPHILGNLFLNSQRSSTGIQLQMSLLLNQRAC
ncbi:uncharacterized protein LOC117337313 isoform X3 [Pecten maximus]|uniref:uncharacterized protein LOC117337313 isoform X3 n=1 Tax=Pecten maximus TaxID=6579 RepID=UPI0014587A2A|nr:uncharacterized protein LOC117337313 isoform X3 [Pecten maximus]